MKVLTIKKNMVEHAEAKFVVVYDICGRKTTLIELRICIDMTWGLGQQTIIIFKD